VTIWLVLLAGLIATLVIPIVVPGSRESKGRLHGMLVGLYMCAVGLAGAGATIYFAVFHGVAGIRRNTLSASFAFESEPVAASITVAVQLLCALAITAFGWHCFKGSRDGTLP
jgi:hypothetical protein